MNNTPEKTPWHTFLRHSILHLTIITAAILFVSLFLFWETKNLKARETTPRLMNLDQKAIQRASPVEVGMHINNFQEFSIQNNQFTMDAIIWFKIPIGSESLETIEKFSVKNSFVLNSGQTIYKYPPIIKVINDDVIIYYYVVLQFKTNLDYRNFPLGNHRIAIEIQNKSVTPYEFYFTSKPNNFVFDKDFKYIVNDWNPISTAIETGYVNASIEAADNSINISYPAAVFSVEFTHVGYQDVIALYFPMLVLFFISLFGLLLDATDPSRLAYAATAIPLLVLFRMVINDISPHISYMTHLDYIYYLLVFLSLLIILFQAFVTLTMQTSLQNFGKIPDTTQKKLASLNTIIFFSILALLVVLTVYSYFR